MRVKDCFAGQIRFMLALALAGACESMTWGLPPVQFGDLGIGGDFFRQQAAGHAERHGKFGFPLRGDAAESRHVEMIVVVVALQHQIDFWKVLERNARGAVPLRAGP